MVKIFKIVSETANITSKQQQGGLENERKIDILSSFNFTYGCDECLRKRKCFYK